MKTITSLQHPLIKHLVKLRENRTYRYSCNHTLIEGKKLLEEVKVKTLLTTHQSLPDSMQADEVILVPEEVMKKVSGMQTPEGYAAEIEIPKKASWNTLKRLLVLDHINDPGNLGALLRTALSLNWDGVFLLGECCDPFNPKAITAARGACFKLPIAEGNWDELHQLATKHQLDGFAADGKGKPLDKVRTNKLMLVMGNEAHGLSPEVKTHCQLISIPISKQMESLNVSVAGGILMYALRENR